LVKPFTDPPGHADATAQRYMMTPSRNESEGTARTTGVSLSSLKDSKLPKKNILLRRTGPPTAPPQMSLSSLGALLGSPDASCDSFRKYSLLEVAVRRANQYAEPL
jgi:hypothetical protein